MRDVLVVVSFPLRGREVGGMYTVYIMDYVGRKSYIGEGTR
jgi:hypothetical protein